MILLIVALAVGLMAGLASAQVTPISYTGMVEENFDVSVGSAGTTAPPGWIIGHSNPVSSRQDPPPVGTDSTNQAMLIDDGSSTSKGNVFNYGTTGDSDRALGGMPTTSGFGDARLQVALVNNTGGPLTTITLTYTGEQWRIRQCTSSSGLEILRVYIGTTPDFQAGTFEKLPPAFEFEAPQDNVAQAETKLDGNLPANRVEDIGGDYTLTTPIASGATFYITWHDWNDNATNDHPLAVDDVVIGSSGATLVAPIDWAYVSLALLEWLRPDPAQAGDPGTVLVDVYFGSIDPNLIPGRHDSVQLESNYNGDTTGSFGKPLTVNTTYYWRVDIIDPNYGSPVTIKGPTWSFITTIPTEIIVTQSGGSTDVSEQDRIPNRDDYVVSLSKAPVAPVTITVSEVLTPIYLSTARETMESWSGENASAARLNLTYGGGIPVLSRINATNDDAEEGADGGMDLGSSDLEIFDDAASDQGPHLTIGLRFNSVAIPQGATIDTAIIEFAVDETNTSGEVHGYVTGEAVIDAPAIGSTAFELTNRLAANPTASVPFAWTADYAVDDIVLTPDIASIIQEIVDQPGWLSGKSILIFLTEQVNYAPVDIEFIDATSPWDPVASTYVLDGSNWEAGVTVTIAAIDDSELESNPHQATLAATASSADVDWDGLPVADVIVNIGDNECGAWSFATYDLNDDCYVDMGDLAMILQEWLTCTTPNISGCIEDYRP